jgi:vitamin B12/bleomycin/antimicrobial peptide transport system ATP-binding/permease protein
MAMRSGFWRDFWALFKPYWVSEEKTVARLLLFSTIALTLASVYMDVLFNDWYNLFYNTLQDKNRAEFFKQMVRFCVLAAIWIVILVYSNYLNQMLQVRWRRWLTEKYLGDWLANRTYYRMQFAASTTDNPDQRIAEDLKFFVDETLSLSLGLLNAVVTLCAFVGILWNLSGKLEFTFAGQHYYFHGFMVWVAVAYAIAGTWLADKIGRPLIGLNFNQQRYEADFRFGLIRFRENMEGVALYRGEEDEMRGFRARFTAVFQNWWSIMRRQKLFNFFRFSFNQAAVVFPYLVAEKRFFSGSIQLGGLIQVANAFGKVQDSLSWLVTNYSFSQPGAGFVGWKATVDRLTGFHNAMLAAREQQRAQPGVSLVTGEPGKIELSGVGLDLPSGKRLVDATNITLAQHSSVLVRGPSGSGKSTLFRAISGIWPFGHGEIKQPAEFDALFLPQRPYFPLGTLREAVCYPARHQAFSSQEIEDAFKIVGLSYLTPRLDELANWSAQLSGGEQQRVAFVRALLHKPAWLFLDEATSNLDDASQRQLYQAIGERLQHTTVISIAHREELACYHDKRVELKCQDSGTYEAYELAGLPA